MAKQKRPAKPTILRANREYGPITGRTDNPDGTTTFTFRTAEPLVVSTSDVTADPHYVINVPNSHLLAVNGEYLAWADNNFLSRTWHLHKMGSRYTSAPTGARLSRKDLGRPEGHELLFDGFDSFAATTKRAGIAPDGWSVDMFGTWVPVGDWRAVTTEALQPCDRRGCGKPTRTGDTKCGTHRGAADRAEAKASAAERERAERDVERDAVDARRRQAENDVRALYERVCEQRGILPRVRGLVECPDEHRVTFDVEVVAGLLRELEMGGEVAEFLKISA